MQATYPLRRSSIQAFGTGLVVVAMLFLAAVGGYWVKSLAPAATKIVTVTRVVPVSATGSSQGLFGSDNPMAANHGIGSSQGLFGSKNPLARSSGAGAARNYAHPHTHSFTE